ncbi:MAG: hypothetical protein K5930_03860 [Treponemataceae bacterium]|nr:hypothetical protein [Treponemataceae bacterium]
MIKQIFSGFTGIIKSSIIVIVCIAVCTALCFAFVWPVWFVSQNHPDGFTTFVLILFSALILYAIVRKVYSSIKKAPDKKAKKTLIFKLVFKTLRAVLSIGLIIAAVNSVMGGHRAAGAVWLVVSIVSFGLTGSLSNYISSRIKL